MRLIVIILLVISQPSLGQLTADFSSSQTNICSGNSIQFNDLSQGSPTSWFWDFGDGNFSTLQNPVNIYESSGQYTVRLTIQNNTGKDYKQVDRYITVNQTPVAGFQILGNKSGCFPLSTSFKDASQQLGATISLWEWSFGDNATSSQQNPSHTYTSQGKYTVSLTVQTSQGCLSTFKISNAITTGAKPLVKFSGAPLSGCANVERNFKNQTTGNISSVEWIFGDSTGSTASNPQHHYQDTGLFDVKLKVSNNGCTDSLTIPKYIYVTGSVARIFKQINCSDPFTYTYNGYAIGSTSFKWDFGDNTTSTNKSVTHTYSKPGVYYVQLSVIGSNCNDTAYDTLRIKTGNPVITISPSKNVHCLNDSLLLSVINFDSISAKSFSWDYGDGTISGNNANYNSIYHVYKNNGNYKPKVYFRNTYYCLDSSSYNGLVNINSPAANFKNDLNGCTNSNVVFKDQSADVAIIKNWLWSFGDGGISTLSGTVKYSYDFPGTYNIHLKVTDENACSDTITHQVEINNSPIVNAGIDTFTCAGSGVTLSASGADSYMWQNNNDLSCINCANPVATPQQSTKYFVTGTSYACSAKDSLQVTVQQKETITLNTDQYAVCSGGNSVMLIASGTDNYSWTPVVTLNNAFVANPIAFPKSNTIYTVKGSDSRNCFTDVKTVEVIVNEKPLVKIADSLIHLMTGFDYTIEGSVSSDVQSYQWIPVTGLSCTNCLQPTITVNGNTSYKLVGENQFGCTDTAHITIVAICSGNAIFMPNTFSPNDDGMNDFFYPRSANTVSIQSLSIFNRWGQLLFQKQNFSTNNAVCGWNGKYKGLQQQADVYIYVMELQCSGHTSVIKKGNISLIR